MAQLKIVLIIQLEILPNASSSSSISLFLCVRSVAWHLIFTKKGLNFLLFLSIKIELHPPHQLGIAKWTPAEKIMSSLLIK